jgi:hypothetical protein
LRHNYKLLLLSTLIILIILCIIRGLSLYYLRNAEYRKQTFYKQSITITNKHNNGSICSLYVNNKIILNEYDCSFYEDILYFTGYPPPQYFNKDVYYEESKRLAVLTSSGNKYYLRDNVLYFEIKNDILAASALTSPYEENPETLYVYDLKAKNNIPIYSDKIYNERLSVSSGGRYVSYMHKDKSNNFIGTRVLDTRYGNIVDELHGLTMCSWYDTSSLICVANDIKILDIKDQRASHTVKGNSKYLWRLITTGIVKYNIVSKKKTLLIKAEYTDEKMYYPMRFGEGIVYFKPTSSSLWFFNGIRPKRIGYHISSSETFSTQDGKLAIRFSETNELLAPGLGGILMRIKWLFFKRNSDLVVVKPENLKEPIK